MVVHGEQYRTEASIANKHAVQCLRTILIEDVTEKEHIYILLMTTRKSFSETKQAQTNQVCC